MNKYKGVKQPQFFHDATELSIYENIGWIADWNDKLLS